MVWEIECPSGRMFHSKADAMMRADRFEIDGNHQCAALLRAAAKYAWHPDVLFYAGGDDGGAA